MMKGPLPRYNALVDAGLLDKDPAQEEAVEQLQSLDDALAAYQPGGFRIFSSKKPAPRGLYLWGGVGRGKTLLMDLFFNNSRFAKKRRVHFHEFMLDIHERIAHWRSLELSEKKRHHAFSRKAPDDPMPPVARDIAADALLLCFDEFQVTDIADAMILGRLFEGLYKNGVVIVATSNRHPDDLYQDGLNRQLFVPFIEELKKRLGVLELKAAKDYRLEKLEKAPVYYQPLGAASDAAMDKAWDTMICGAKERRETLTVQGRKLVVEHAARGAARFDFATLFERPLGSADYLALARRYGAIFIDGIPIMGPEKRDAAKRFVTMIDALYDARVKLVCSADGEPNDLYPAGDGSFEFERTASRLMEMRSAEFLAAAHKDTAPEAPSA